MHNRNFFYKYVSGDVAEKVLESGKLMWSAPHLFNDPFDHQISYQFPFTGVQAAERLFQVQHQIVFGPDEPVLLEKKPLGMVSLELRRVGLRGDAKENAIRHMREAAEKVADSLDVFQEKLNEALKTYLSHSRVLCVSEDNSNVVMWSHYADQHRGAVIRLNCIEELDDNLLSARKITYSEDFPEFLSLNDWVDSNFGVSAINYGKMALDLAYLKHKDWEYEQEWRVHIPLMPYEPAGDGMSLYEKHPSAFASLYLGCRMSDEAQQRLIRLARHLYPQMEIFRASMSRVSFNLEFEKVE